MPETEPTAAEAFASSPRFHELLCESLGFAKGIDPGLLALYLEVLDDREVEEADAWLADRATVTTGEAQALRAYFKAMAGNTARVGCVRRYRMPTCRFYVPASLGEAHCVAVCPHPVVPKPPKPAPKAGPAPEAEGLDFDDFDWEG